MTRYVVRPKRPILKMAVLAFVAVVLWTGGQKLGVAIEVALVLAWMTRRAWLPHKSVKPTVDQAQLAELADQVTELAGEVLRYRALLAAVLMSYPEGFKIDRDTAAAADRLEVYVAPTVDGGIMASAGYPVKERSA